MVVDPLDSATVQVYPGLPCARAALALRALPTSQGKETLRERLFRIMRLLMVGLWASAVDLGVLTTCVRWFHLDATVSRFIALVVSGLALFIGCRSFAFRAQGGSISRQAKLFVVAELVAFPLNLLVFHLLATYAPFIAPEFTSQAANFMVFVAFASPVRRLLVFRGCHERPRVASAQVPMPLALEPGKAPRHASPAAS